MRTTTAAEAGDTETFTFTINIVWLYIEKCIEKFCKLRETLSIFFYQSVTMKKCRQSAGKLLKILREPSTTIIGEPKQVML